MKRLLAFALGGTALMGMSMMGPAQAADFEPVTVFPFAATAFVGGGGSWLTRDNCDFECDSEIAHIVGGGDIVLPLNGFWNMQLGGASFISHQAPDGCCSDTTTQFQGSAIGFWRDPALGVFGIETGFFSPSGGDRPTPLDFNSFKVGGVAEYFFSDLVTIGGFGGALIPLDPNPFENRKVPQVETGFYAGGHLTYYASDTIAVAGFARWTELNSSNRGGSINTSQQSLNVGGKIRYLTSVPGLEVYASGSYRACETRTRFNQGRGPRTRLEDGAQVMGGIKVRLGGHTDSLVAIDRSNAIDTRAWACVEVGPGD